jgi:hypothetical protein
VPAEPVLRSTKFLERSVFLIEQASRGFSFRKTLHHIAAKCGVFAEQMLSG